MKKTILLNLLFFLLFVFLNESISRILNLENLTGSSSNLITYKEGFFAEEGPHKWKNEAEKKGYEK